jgi:hypothetical protein
MILTIELTPEEEERLKAEATRRNLEPTELLHSLISTLKKPMSGADAIAYWEANNLESVFATRPEDSPELARKLREETERRDWSAL